MTARSDHSGAFEPSAPPHPGEPDDDRPARSQADRRGDGARSAVQGDAASDEELIRRVVEARDKQAFAALFERYAGRIKAMMIASGAAADAAEEAAQEAMIAVWRRAETFDSRRASAAAWIFTIARNKRVDLLRRAKRAEPDLSDPAFAQADAPPAEKGVAAFGRDAAVRRAVSSLSPEQLEVVVLSFYEGRAHSEIAEKLGLPLGTVKSRLRLAFGKLRARLGDGFRGELRDE